VLLVDGYNDIEHVSSRRRAGCYAHVRRHFFESIKTAPVAQQALDMMTELYRVEHARRSVEPHTWNAEQGARDDLDGRG